MNSETSLPILSQALNSTLEAENSEQRTLLRQHFLHMLHAETCSQRESTADDKLTNCFLPNCAIMKWILEHMKSCNTGEACTFPQCALSTTFLTHWHGCLRGACSICALLKETTTRSIKYSLKFWFDMSNFGKLKPGDTIPSTCPTTEPSHLHESVAFSSCGFPLHFSLSLIAVATRPRLPDIGMTKKTFLLQLCLDKPRNISFLPPVLIQPTLISGEGFRRVSFEQRHVGPHQPGFWKISITAPSPHTLFWISGKLLFQILDEPMYLLACLPSKSEAEWSSLPSEMVVAVLRELPLAERVRARLVCKYWANILDTSAGAWNNVTYLQTGKANLVLDTVYDYHGGRLNQVPYDQLFTALRFFASRNARIQSLEIVPSINDNDFTLPNLLKEMPSIFSELNITLKSLAFHCLRNLYVSVPNIVDLLNSQPTIERLYINLNRVSLPPSLHLILPRLRILSLSMTFTHSQMIGLQAQLPFLYCLKGLRLILTPDRLNSGVSNKISNIVANLLPSFRRVVSVAWDGPRKHPIYGCLNADCRYEKILVFGTDDLSSATTAFLLMPKDFSANNGDIVSHYCI